MEKLLLIILIIICSGCATAPKTASTYDQTPIKEPNPGNGILVFYRTVTPPAAYHMEVLIDDVLVAELPNEAFSWVELELGKHKVIVEWSAWSGMPSKRYDIDLNAGGVNYLELNNAANVPPVLDLAFHLMYGVEENKEETAAMYEQRKIKKCCRYVPAITSNKQIQTTSNGN